jgi:NAD(P)-dependent dehydrogenase (short-subunit alcohol dehydrogenase family)
MALPEGVKDFSLESKAALVIGAEHEVGRVAALTLVEAGAKTVIASQKHDGRDALDDLAKALQKAGQRQVSIQLQDTTNTAEVRATMESAAAALGGLDILVTALDTPFYAPFDETDDTALARVMDDNFKAVWTACREAGRIMLRNGGVIVNISNVMAERGVPNATAYCAAQGAVRNFVRALALEWARRRIRVNMIECGWLDARRSPAVSNDEFSERLIKYLPYRRLLKPEEIAGALLYLVSSAAGFVTGESIAVDGGLLCRV